MPATKSIKSTGVLAIWELGNAALDLTATRAIFEAAGLGKYKPNPRTDLACLQTSLTALYSRRADGTNEATRIEPCGDGYAVTVATPDPVTHRVEYRHLISAWLDRNETGATVMRCDDITRWDAIRDGMEAARSGIEGAAVSKALVNALCDGSMGGIPLRRAGGVYWLPEGSDGRWRTLAAGIEAASTTGLAKCWSITTTGDADSVRAIADAFVREMEAEVRETEEMLLAGADPKAMTRRASSMLALQDLADRYESVLDTSLAAIRERLDDVRVRAAQTAVLAS